MSVALFVPAVCENSAQFFYENRYVFLFSNRLLKDPNGQKKKKNEDEANQNRMLKKKRGLWALIMAQTGMGVFTGEQITSFVVRMVRHHFKLLSSHFLSPKHNNLPWDLFLFSFRAERQQV